MKSGVTMAGIVRRTLGAQLHDVLCGSGRQFSNRSRRALSSLSQGGTVPATTATTRTAGQTTASSDDSTKVMLSSFSESSSASWLIDASCAQSDWVAEHVCVVSDVISQDEHDLLVGEILNGKDASLVAMRARAYEADHWDSVITNYKELQRPLEKWLDPRNVATLKRIQSVVEGLTADAMVPPGSSVQAWLPPHIIDLAADGFIDGHVDSVKFSGQLVAGLSLLSTRTMVLTPARAHFTSESDDRQLDDGGDGRTTDGTIGKSCEGVSAETTTQNTDPSPANCVRLLLPPRSLYVLKHSARFQYEHSIPLCDTWEQRQDSSGKGSDQLDLGLEKARDIAENSSKCQEHEEEVVGSERRLSIMFRDDLPPAWMCGRLPAHVISGRIEEED
jgi:hypothetical protein